MEKGCKTSSKLSGNLSIAVKMKHILISLTCIPYSVYNSMCAISCYVMIRVNALPSSLISRKERSY